MPSKGTEAGSDQTEIGRPLCRPDSSRPVLDRPVRTVPVTLLRLRRLALNRHDGSYLVDPASSHMLVSKIKPCMSKYKQFVR